MKKDIYCIAAMGTPADLVVKIIASLPASLVREIRPELK